MANKQRCIIKGNKTNNIWDAIVYPVQPRPFLKTDTVSKCFIFYCPKGKDSIIPSWDHSTLYIKYMINKMYIYKREIKINKKVKIHTNKQKTLLLETLLLHCTLLWKHHLDMVLLARNKVKEVSNKWIWEYLNINFHLNIRSTYVIICDEI